MPTDPPTPPTGPNISDPWPVNRPGAKPGWVARRAGIAAAKEDKSKRARRRREGKDRYA